jgi:hypothetical protein
VARLFSRASTGPAATPEYERVWIAFEVDRGASYERVGFSQQNMDAFATWLPMLVADAALCGFGDMPEDGLLLVNAVSAFADEMLERIERTASGREQLGELGLATRARDWLPAEYSSDAFRVHCEIDLWEEERIKALTSFTPPDAATPEACRELIWVAWDWIADGGGLHPSSAALGAQHLRSFAAVIQGAGVLPSAHDRGYAPLVVLEQAQETANEARGGGRTSFSRP